jgi:hypothetical protein
VSQLGTSAKSNGWICLIARIEVGALLPYMEFVHGIIVSLTRRVTVTVRAESPPLR